MPKNLLKLKNLLLAAVLVTLVACAGPGAEKVLDDIAKDPLGGAFIADVPFFAEDKRMCGPAALASVMGYYGDNDGLDEVAKGVFSKRLKGTLPMDLLIYAKEKGFEAKYYEGDLEDIKTNLSAGRPLILFLNLGIPEYPVGHYVVAIGYNDRFSTIIAHSGMNEAMLISYKRLEKAWSMTGYSTLLLTPAPSGEVER